MRFDECSYLGNVDGVDEAWNENNKMKDGKQWFGGARKTNWTCTSITLVFCCFAVSSCFLRLNYVFGHRNTHIHTHVRRRSDICQVNQFQTYFSLSSDNSSYPSHLGYQLLQVHAIFLVATIHIYVYMYIYILCLKWLIVSSLSLLKFLPHTKCLIFCTLHYFDRLHFDGAKSAINRYTQFVKCSGQKLDCL